MTQPEQSNTHAAAVDAASVLDAMDRPEVIEKYTRCCLVLEDYAAALQTVGVPRAQIACQLHSAAVAVILKAMGVDF